MNGEETSFWHAIHCLERWPTALTKLWLSFQDWSKWSYKFVSPLRNWVSWHISLHPCIVMLHVDLHVLNYLAQHAILTFQNLETLLHEDIVLLWILAPSLQILNVRLLPLPCLLSWHTIPQKPTRRSVGWCEYWRSEWFESDWMCDTTNLLSMNALSGKTCSCWENHAGSHLASLKAMSSLIMLCSYNRSFYKC